MAKKQYYGITYPFKSEKEQHFYLDANTSMSEMVRSLLMHVVFTPKNQMIRKPEFGTDLIKHIFSPNDETTWEAIKTEVKDSVSRWIPNLSINNIQVVKNTNNEAEIYVRLDYSVIEGNKETSDSVVVQL